MILMLPQAADNGGEIGDMNDDRSRATERDTRRVPTGAHNTLDAFSQFYAVVLDHEAGGSYRVRWSSRHAAWLSTYPYASPGRSPWHDEPRETLGRPDAPDEESRQAALALARRVTHPPVGQPFYCQQCWQHRPDAHFIAPDVHGSPTLYCVQVPSYEVVDSFGGNGQKKHWGSPFACHAVKSEIDPGLVRDPRIGPVAAYVFGRPLPADEVIDREWCSRCLGAAENVRSNAAREGADEAEWAQARTEVAVRNLGRMLSSYFGA